MSQFCACIPLFEIVEDAISIVSGIKSKRGYELFERVQRTTALPPALLRGYIARPDLGPNWFDSVDVTWPLRITQVRNSPATSLGPHRAWMWAVVPILDVSPTSDIFINNAVDDLVPCTTFFVGQRITWSLRIWPLLHILGPICWKAKRVLFSETAWVFSWWATSPEVIHYLFHFLAFLPLGAFKANVTSANHRCMARPDFSILRYSRSHTQQAGTGMIESNVTFEQFLHDAPGNQG